MRNHPSLDTKPGAHDRSRTGWVRPWCMVVLVASMATGCASRQEPPAAAEPPVPMTHCASGGVSLDAHFQGGQLGQCSSDGDRRFSLVLHPEDAPPINPSPWYAFRITGAEGAPVAQARSPLIWQAQAE